MPPKDGKALITDNLEKFSGELLILVANETVAGREQLLSAMEKAKETYKAPQSNFFTGWFYRFTRTRTGAVELAEQSIKTFPDAYTRLQELKNFLKDGNWTTTSYNYYLFIELIGLMTEYEPLDLNQVEHTKETLISIKNLLNKRIDTFTAEFKKNQDEINKRNIERQKTAQSNKRNTENVVILNKSDGVAELAKENPQKIYFSLGIKDKKPTDKNTADRKADTKTTTDKIYRLHWIDPIGITHLLEVSSELANAIKQYKIHDVENVSPLQLQNLRRECIKARQELINSVSLQINPCDPQGLSLSDEALVASGVTCSFILRGLPHQYSITWINTLGNAKLLVPAEYSELMAWLNSEVSTPDNEEFILQLKARLLKINTNQSIDKSEEMEQFKRNLQACLNHGPSKPSKSSDPASEDADSNAAVKSKKLDMKLYAHIDACLKGEKSPPDSLDTQATAQDDSYLTLDTQNSESAFVPPPPPPPHKRLNADRVSSFASLFAKRGQSEEAAEPNELTSNPTGQ